MKSLFKSILVAIIGMALVAPLAYGSDAAQPAKKRAAAKAKTPPQPSLQDQIQALRQALDTQASQIDSLKTGMAEKDERLQPTRKQQQQRHRRTHPPATPPSARMRQRSQRCKPQWRT